MTSLSPVAEKTCLPPALQQLKFLIQTENEMTPSRARDLLIQAGLQQEDLMDWADFDHPVENGYGRQLVYDGGFFEMMVMSWNPGDCSAIHDHGHTQWGAVQIFGPAEHAVFLVQDGEIKTLARAGIQPGQVLAVGHQLVHQMRNPSNSGFLTFHLYGSRDGNSPITGGARVFALEENSIQRTHGGVFLGLPEKSIVQREPGPRPDYLTWLRQIVELMNRFDRIKNQSFPNSDWTHLAKQLQENLFDPNQWDWFEEDLMRHVDPKTGQVDEIGFWKLLRNELTLAAETQKKLLHARGEGDPFSTYAELYDAVVGQPCLDEFISGYLKFVVGKYRIDAPRANLLSIGCGTGIVEEYLINELGFKKERLWGIDKSESMVRVAQRRIRAECRDLLTQTEQKWDLTFCGLNVFQYLAPENLEQAVEIASKITRPGGYFIGDFITPDHIRIYPHVIRSKDGTVISLRQPVLVEKGNCTFQESEIINMNRKTGQLLITCEGKHLRFLPSLWRLRRLFETRFEGQVDVYDAVSLNPIEETADTCPSTRILIVARRGEK